LLMSRDKLEMSSNQLGHLTKNLASGANVIKLFSVIYKFLYKARVVKLG
jgi:hypothetical protein